jgi:hypothetical protein
VVAVAGDVAVRRVEEVWVDDPYGKMGVVLRNKERLGVECIELALARRQKRARREVKATVVRL